MTTMTTMLCAVSLSWSQWGYIRTTVPAVSACESKTGWKSVTHVAAGTEPVD